MHNAKVRTGQRTWSELDRQPHQCKGRCTKQLIRAGFSGVKVVLEMTKLVEVPMRVQVPPNTAAYDSGISSFLGLTPDRRDHAMMILSESQHKMRNRCPASNQRHQQPFGIHTMERLLSELSMKTRQLHIARRSRCHVSAPTAFALPEPGTRCYPNLKRMLSPPL